MNNINNMCYTLAQRMIKQKFGSAFTPTGSEEVRDPVLFAEQMKEYFASISKMEIVPPAEMVECITAIAQAVYDSKNGHEPGISSEEMSMREALEEMREKNAAISSHALEEVASKYFEGKITDEQRALLRELSTDKSMREHAASLGWSLEHVHSVLGELKISRKK